MFDENDFYWKHKAEIYRENYQDALDELRELRSRIKELETANHYLTKNIKKTKKPTEKDPWFF